MPPSKIYPTVLPLLTPGGTICAGAGLMTTVEANALFASSRRPRVLGLVVAPHRGHGVRTEHERQ